MLKIFPKANKRYETDRVQGKLLLFAGIIVIILALILMLAPMIRYHGEAEGYRLDHWVGVTIWSGAFALLHFQSSKKLPGRDPVIIPVVSLLTGIGLLTIYRLYPNMGLRQAIWIAIASIIVIFGINYPNFIGYLRKYKYIWLLAGFLLIGLTFFIGTNPGGNGPTLWLKFFGIHFQPSEFLKILLIIFLSSFFTDQLVAVYKKFDILLPTLFVVSTAVILLIFQRDLGTATIFLLIFLGFIFSTKSDNKIYFSIAVLAMAIVTGAYLYIDIVRLRFDAWLNPFVEPSGASYQVIQSMIAIAEGGIFGTGFGLGSPSLIPVSLSDFIFSAIAEESGFLSAALIVSLIIILIYRGLKLALSTQYSFDRYLALGLVFYFGIQSSLIIGGNIGFLPLTGVTLPFVSYGGSSLVVSFIAMLLLLLISNRSEEIQKREMFLPTRSLTLGRLLIAVLAIELIITSLESFWFKTPLVERPENPRWVIDDRFSERGNILDRDNQVIIYNKGEIGNYQRESNHIPLYPVVGYTNATYGQTGIEESMFQYLRGLEGYPPSQIFWHDSLYNQPPLGLDVRLTIDLDLQKEADSLLGDVPGAIVLMNAQTGEILSMASHPYFDAKNLEENWENLIKDQDAPLINRTTQGLYPPGAVLFPFIATTQIDLIQENEQPGLITDGILQLETCAINPGLDLTWQSVITNGCQAIQTRLAEISGWDEVFNIYQNLNLFSPPNLRLNVALAGNPGNENLEEFFVEEGNFNVTPLQVALAASAITNQGILPAPRLVNGYHNSQGEWITLPKLSENIQAIDPQSSLRINNLLAMPDSAHWQVTSTATTEDDRTITWFVAGTGPNWQGQPTTVVVLLERDAPTIAEQIGLSLLGETIQTVSDENIN